MKDIKKKWAFMLLMVIVLAFAIATPVLADGDGPTSDQVNDLTLGINIMWMIVGGFLVFFMQAGFALVETGFTRNKNVAHTMTMNMMVFCIGAVGYWLTGFALQFGGVNHLYPAVGSVGEWSFSPTTLSGWLGDRLNSPLLIGGQVWA